MKCSKCDQAAVGRCLHCHTPVCSDHQAPPNEATGAFTVYCSEECRDAACLVAEMKTIDCPECGGTGIWKKGQFGMDRNCFTCGGNADRRGRGYLNPGQQKRYQERQLARTENTFS